MVVKCFIDESHSIMLCVCVQIHWLPWGLHSSGVSTIGRMFIIWMLDGVDHTIGNYFCWQTSFERLLRTWSTVSNTYIYMYSLQLPVHM